MNNKIAIITGGSRGLGKNTALKLAAQGVDIILTYRNQQAEAAQVVAAIEGMGGRAVALALDVGDSQTFADFAVHIKAALQQHWQRTDFDFFINNAGMEHMLYLLKRQKHSLIC